MATENQKTKEDTQADYAEFLYDVLEKVQKGQIIFAQAVYLIDEAAKVKYATPPAQESSDAVEFAEWVQLNYKKEDGYWFHNSGSSREHDIRDLYSIFLKEKGGKE